VHVSEVDWTFVRNVPDELSVGQVVAVEIFALEPDEKRAQLSVKRPLTASREPRPSPSLVPGGLPLDWRAFAGAEEDDRESGDGEDLREERDALRNELCTLSEDRAALRRHVPRSSA
jgi:predicted RNA-binding protein with RPS1 domain